MIPGVLQWVLEFVSGAEIWSFVMLVMEIFGQYFLKKKVTKKNFKSDQISAAEHQFFNAMYKDGSQAGTRTEDKLEFLETNAHCQN